MRFAHRLSPLPMILLAAAALHAQPAEQTAPRHARLDMVRTLAGSQPSGVDFRFDWGSGMMLGSDGSAMPMTMSGYTITPDGVTTLWSDPMMVPKSGGTLTFSWALGMARAGEPTRDTRAVIPATPEQRMLAGASTLVAVEIVDAESGKKLAAISSRWLRGDMVATRDTASTATERVEMASMRGRTVRLRAMLYAWYIPPAGRSILGRPVYTVSDYGAIPQGGSTPSERPPDRSSILR